MFKHGCFFLSRYANRTLRQSAGLEVSVSVDRLNTTLQWESIKTNVVHHHLWTQERILLFTRGENWSCSHVSADHRYVQRSHVYQRVRWHHVIISCEGDDGGVITANEAVMTRDSLSQRRCLQLFWWRPSLFYRKSTVTSCFCVCWRHLWIFPVVFVATEQIFCYARLITNNPDKW